MSNLDNQARAAIGNLKEVVSQLQSGDLSLLYARRDDKEWTDGAAAMIAHYQQIVNLLEQLLEERRLREEQLTRRRAKKAALRLQKPPQTR